jgi:GST-like protein
MIELLGMGSPNVVKVILMLEETELAYGVRRIDVITGEQHEEAFRRHNPNGKVPVLIDPDGSAGAITVFESGAILIYLAEKVGRFLPIDQVDRSATLQWLMWQMAALGPMSGQAIHFSAVTRTDSYGRNRFVLEKNRLLDLLDRRLAESAFVGGVDYSIADMAVFPWVRTLRRFFRDDPARSHVERWFDAIRQRPAWLRAEAVADALSDQDRQAFAAATPEQLDRYFGRTHA